ncbi:LptF/LptG family permease [bacterium]|nr:LptF/LptG family permease [bacterium]
MGRILRLYVIRAILTPTLMALLTITFIMMVQMINKSIDLFMQPGVRLSQVLGILGLFLPWMITYAAPMAALVGTMIGVGRMVMDREILAMRASGINLLSIFLPTILAGLLLSGSMMWLSREAIPGSLNRGTRGLTNLTYAWVNTLKPGQKYTADKLNLKEGGGLGNFMLYFASRDEQRHEMRGIIIKLVPDETDVVDGNSKKSDSKDGKKAGQQKSDDNQDKKEKKESNKDKDKDKLEKQRDKEKELAKILTEFYESTTGSLTASSTTHTLAADIPTTVQLDMDRFVRELHARGLLPASIDKSRLSDDPELIEDLAAQRRDNDMLTIFGQSGRLESDLVRDERGKTHLIYQLAIRNGSLHLKSGDPQKKQYIMFRFEQTSFTQVRDGELPPQTKMLSSDELRRELKAGHRVDDAGNIVLKDEARKASAELVERQTMPMALFVFMLVGIPLAIRVRTGGKSWAILLAIGMMLVYFVLLQTGLSMVERQKAFGVAVAFLPNLLFVALGGLLWWQTLRS